MPDVYTHHPEVVRDLLGEGGFTCGVEPRILEGRDPDWTCVVDGARVSGDLYIHERSEGLGLPFWLALAVAAVLVAVVAAQTIAIVRLRHRARAA